MYNKKFKIKNNVLIKYKGKDDCVVIPDGVKEIGSRCFQYNLKIKSVVFPDSVERICTQAFSGCENIESITLNNGLKQIGDFAFFMNTNLKKVVFPSTLLKIENNAFRDCLNLEEVKFNKNLKYIGTQAFENCGCLKNVYIPRKTKLGSAVFPNSDIKEFTFGNRDYKVVENCLYSRKHKTLLMSFTGGEVNVCDGTKKIKNWAFKGKYKISIPKSVKDFGCYHILNEHLKFNSDNSRFVKIDNCIFDTKKNRLVQSWGTKNLAIDNIKIIGEDSLGFLRNCSTIRICEGVTKIEKAAMSANLNTKVFTVPSTVKKISIDAFSLSLKLEKIIFTRGVRKIDFTDFYGVLYPKLRYIQIPPSVKSLKGYNEEMKNITIICHKNSCAYRYAKRNKLKFNIMDDEL